MLLIVYSLFVLMVVGRATAITQKASSDEAATHYLSFMAFIYQGTLPTSFNVECNSSSPRSVGMEEEGKRSPERASITQSTSDSYPSLAINGYHEGLRPKDAIFSHGHGTKFQERPPRGIERAFAHYSLQ